jgi:hypothetical protein
MGQKTRNWLTCKVSSLAVITNSQKMLVGFAGLGFLGHRKALKGTLAA